MLHVVVPAREASKRLPGKMLARLGGRMVIEHSLGVVDAAIAQLDFPADRAVVTDSAAIAAIVGGAVWRDPENCRSGSDAVAHVATSLAWPDTDIVVGVQADMPFLDPAHLAGFLRAAARGGTWELLTAFAEVPLVEVGALPPHFRRRTVVSHVGLYAWTVGALKRFAALPSSDGETRERLEQLRAAEAGMMIAFHALPAMPAEVNTPPDLAALTRILDYGN